MFSDQNFFFVILGLACKFPVLHGINIIISHLLPTVGSVAEWSKALV